MAMRLQNGQFVKVPGHYVVLKELTPANKVQLWNGINRRSPGYAAMITSLKSDPLVQALEQQFDASLCMTEPQFNQYMKAGATNPAQPEGDKGAKRKRG